MELYRYFRFETGLKTLKSKQLKLSAIDEYNDPFELIPQTKNVDAIVSALRNNKLKDILKTEIGQKIAKEFEEEGLIDDSTALIATGAAALISPTVAFALYGLYALFSKDNKNSEDECLEIYLRHYIPLLRDIKCACFSEVNNSILMWSHYAEQHEGMVISFSPYINFWRGAEFRKINYSDFRPELPNKKTRENEYVWKLLMNKAECWDYEKEWRLIHMDKPGEDAFMSINKDAVKSIILGVRCDDKKIQQCTDVRDRLYPNAKIYAAKHNPNDYKLNIRPID